MGRVRDAGREPVVRHDGDEAPRGEPLADEGLARLVAVAQAAAVEGDEHGRPQRALGHVDVEPVLPARVVRGGEVVHVRDDADAAGPARRQRERERRGGGRHVANTSNT